MAAAVTAGTAKSATATVESTAASMEAIAATKAAAVPASKLACAIALKAACAKSATESASTESATASESTSEAPVKAPTVEAVAIKASATVPRTGADKDAIHKITRAPIAIRRTIIWIVAVVAVGAHRSRPVVAPVSRTVPGSHGYPDSKLRIRVRCSEKQNPKQCRVF